MKKDLKAEIIITARNLFNEYGYNDVSIRNIADALHISVGNLTYHFKKKEDLIEAVIVEQHKNYRKSQPLQTLEELGQFFHLLVQHHSQHLYYFRHYEQLAQLCPKVYQIQLSVMQDLYDLMTETFANLQRAQLVSPEAFPNQMNGIIQTLMTVCTYGVPYFEKSANQDIESMILSSLWSVIYLSLTEEGKKIYHQKIESKKALL